MLAHHMSFPQKQTLLSAASDYWNARIANGTPPPLERAKRYWNCAQRHTLTLKCVNFVNFVNN